MELIRYGPNEGEIECDLGDLVNVNIPEYPDFLVSRITIPEEHAVPVASLYILSNNKQRIQFTVFLGDDDGVWNKNIATKAIYFQLTELTKSGRHKEVPNIIFEENSIYATFSIERRPGNLYQKLIDLLGIAKNLVTEAEEKIQGFTWSDRYQKDEPYFTNEFIIPLLCKMGFEHVRYNHGASEFGKDILFSERDKFSNIRYCAAQVKAGNISGESGSIIDKLISQIDDSFSIAVEGAGQQKQYNISDLYIIASGNISANAVKKINSKLDSKIRGSVFFVDKNDLGWLARKYWPF